MNFCLRLLSCWDYTHTPPRSSFYFIFSKLDSHTCLSFLPHLSIFLLLKLLCHLLFFLPLSLLNHIYSQVFCQGPVSPPPPHCSSVTSPSRILLCPLPNQSSIASYFGGWLAARNKSVPRLCAAKSVPHRQCSCMLGRQALS